MPRRFLPAGDPGKPGRRGSFYQEPDPVDPTPAPLPAVRRLDYDTTALDAVEASAGDPNYRAATSSEAFQLAPLRQIQSSFDQTAAHADNLRRGEPFPYPGGFRAHVLAVIGHAERRRDVLRMAAAKADAAIEHYSEELLGLDDAMSNRNKPPEHVDPDDGSTPVSGDPHPLVDGGYDPGSDPQLAASESDVNALKSGHTTRAQAEAIARSDLSGPPAAKPAAPSPGINTAPAKPEPAPAPPAAVKPAEKPADPKKK